jgi:hypothetical protein
MHQKAIVLYLHMRGMSPDAIHENLMRVRVLGENAVAYCTVTKYVRSEKFPPMNDGPPLQPIRIEPGPVDQAIVTALADCPFSSVRELSRLTCLPRSTVHRQLTGSLHFRIQHVRWIPHLLNPEQKWIRVNMAGELLRVLSVQGARQWHDLLRLDESWFYLYSEQDLIEMALGEIVPNGERYIVQSPEFMVTIVWDPSGFHAVKALPKRSKFNAQYHSNNILVAISDRRRLSGRTQQSKLWLWVHANNARPHTAECRLTRSFVTR